MEHLSAEERACLTFLEETIESLEAEDDNGISGNRRDLQSRNKMAHLSAVSQVAPQGLSVHDDPNKFLQKDRRSNKLLVPTPLVLANGNAKLLKKKDYYSTEPKPPALVSSSKPTASNPSKAFPTPEVIDAPPSFIPEPPVRHNISKGPPSKNNPPKISLDSRSDQSPQSVLSDLPVMLLPPPSDFMDKPMLLPPVHSLPEGQNQPQTSTLLSPQSETPSQPCRSEKLPIAPRPEIDGHIGTNNLLPSMSTSPRGQLSPNDLDKLRKKASMKRTPEMIPVVPVKSGHNASPQANSPTFGPGYSGVEYEEPKSPPNVAPKPKKLPSSIVLKTHKDAAPGHSLVSPGDRMIINQQKVHLEALKKLGLLKTAEIDSGLCSSPQNKTSPHSPSATLPSERTASPVRVAPKHHAVVKTQDEPDFSYLSVQPERGERDNLLPARTPSPKPFEMKPVSMERSGVGRKSLTLENVSRVTSQEESLENTLVSFGHLRNSRSQPARAESFKGVGVKETESNHEPELRRSLPIPVPSLPKTESQKAIRSHGISVIISPQNTDGEDRRQALRRLGLGLIND